MDPTSVRHAIRKGLNQNPQTNQTEIAPPPYTASATQLPRLAPNQQQPRQITTLLPEQDVDTFMSDDEDDEDDDTEAPLHFSIDNATTVEGTGNRISVPRVDGPRLGHLIHGVLTSQYNPYGAQHPQTITPSSSTTEQRYPYSNRRISITINCGVTVTGNSNVVMMTTPGAPNLLRAPSSTGLKTSDEVLTEKNERKRNGEQGYVGAPNSKTSRTD